MFHVLEREFQWRREHGKHEGFDALRAHRPIVAIGADEPLEDQEFLSDYFRKLLCFSFIDSTGMLHSLSYGPSSIHICDVFTDKWYYIDGTDGLGGIHTSVGSVEDCTLHDKILFNPVLKHLLAPASLAYKNLGTPL
jgi:hypothetical protein